MHFFPNDHPPNVVPTHTLGDGNCFPWAVSNVLFRTQNRHVKIHVRLVFEAVLNEQLYLRNKYLSWELKEDCLQDQISKHHLLQWCQGIACILVMIMSQVRECR